jgi:protein-tyrosine phosphatase
MKINLTEPKDRVTTKPLQKFALSLEEEIKKSADTREPIEPVAWDNLQVFPDDRSLPAPVVFRWQTDGQLCKNTLYRLSIYTDKDFKKPVFIHELSEQSAEILHLHTATRYHWQVQALCKSGIKAESPLYSFVTAKDLPRWISVPGITNVRDIGGWPLPGDNRVRQGMAYRSSEMNTHLAINRKGKQVLLDELGIRTDLDIRKENAQPALNMKQVNWINIPVRPYADIVDPEQQDSYRRIFELFAEPERYPVLFHCWGGADRAGTVAFLLNALLGVSMENLARDYELTTLSIWGVRSRESTEFRELLEELSAYAAGASINRQVEKYLLSTGLDAKHIQTIRGLLTEKAPF